MKKIEKGGRARVRLDIPWEFRIIAYIELTDNCWKWLSSKNAQGYGILAIRGVPNIASRLAYELFIGDFDKSLCVLHKCDNPECCNPDHLFLGTREENHIDMMRKGRHSSVKKTHCKRNHPLYKRNIDGHRYCAICSRKASLEYYHKNKQLNPRQASPTKQ